MRVLVPLPDRDLDIIEGPVFVAQDGSYISARWLGDAYLFARRQLAF